MGGWVPPRSHPGPTPHHLPSCSPPSLTLLPGTHLTTSNLREGPASHGAVFWGNQDARSPTSTRDGDTDGYETGTPPMHRLRVAGEWDLVPRVADRQAGGGCRMRPRAEPPAGGTLDRWGLCGRRNTCLGSEQAKEGLR